MAAATRLAGFQASEAFDPKQALTRKSLRRRAE
jgi:hypothetical protein